MGVLRPHLALAGTDVERAGRFYEALFGAVPEKREPGYARFSVAEPALNFTLTQFVTHEDAEEPGTGGGAMAGSAAEAGSSGCSAGTAGGCCGEVRECCAA
jgi:catechol 2,3-dioxygenase-like lactoylglutathione lyase family enzyme